MSLNAVAFLVEPNSLGPQHDRRVVLPPVLFVLGELDKTPTDSGFFSGLLVETVSAEPSVIP